MKKIGLQPVSRTCGITPFGFQVAEETRQVYNLFQDLWNKFLGFPKGFKKGSFSKSSERVQNQCKM